MPEKGLPPGSVPSLQRRPEGRLVPSASLSGIRCADRRQYRLEVRDPAALVGPPWRHRRRLPERGPRCRRRSRTATRSESSSGGNGHCTLSILALQDGGLPNGRYPRLVLACVTTEAMRGKEPEHRARQPLLALCAALEIPPTIWPAWDPCRSSAANFRPFASTFRSGFHDGSQFQRPGTGHRCATAE
jgi:hypothetical protein